MKKNLKFVPESSQTSGVELFGYQVLGERTEQQDRFLIAQLHDGYLIMLTDGHQCSRVSQFVANHVTEIYVKCREHEVLKNGTPSASRERKIIKKTINKLFKLTRHESCGSTLTLCFLQCGQYHFKDKTIAKGVMAHVGQVGDSIFSISQDSSHLSIAPIHCVEQLNKDIVNIKKSADRAIRVYDGYVYSGVSGESLAMTRALGDSGFTLIRKPEVKTFKALQKDCIILLSTDGILDANKTTKQTLKETFNFLRTGGNMVEQLNNNNQRVDNTSVIVIRFHDIKYVKKRITQHSLW